MNFACTHGVVMVVGFDGFREVINNYGYRGGDEILADFAVQVRRICPQTAALYRFEGDEFAIFIPGGTCCQAQQLFQSLAPGGQGTGQPAGQPGNHRRRSLYAAGWNNAGSRYQQAGAFSGAWEGAPPFAAGLFQLGGFAGIPAA